MAIEKVTVYFAGKPLACRADTSIAVALWEAGVRVLSHSPKFGRPRGLFCARGHCTSCLMRVDGVPNVRTCRVPIRAGQRIERQDAGALYARPMQRVLDAGDPFFPAGFYFKWFTRPAAVSRLFLQGLRPLTGIGRLPAPETWSAGEPVGHDRGVFDVVIVGAGLAGLRATYQTGGRALLVDDHVELGGQRRAALAMIAQSLGESFAEALPVLARAHQGLSAAVAAARGRARIEHALDTQVVAGYQPDTLLLRDARGLAMLRTRALVWAAGGLDVIGLFEGNDLPGLFGPRALYRLVCLDGMRLKGRRAVVAGGGLDLWLSATLLHAAGAKVTVVLGETGWADETRTAVRLGWQLHTGLRPTAARRREETLLQLSCDAPDGAESSVNIECELAVIAQRGKPVYDIPYQLGADLALNTSRGGYLPRGLAADPWHDRLPGGLAMTVTGEAAGERAEALLTDPLPFEKGARP